eukprot:5877396-Amphidinium_carterae.1
MHLIRVMVVGSCERCPLPLSEDKCKLTVEANNLSMQPPRMAGNQRQAHIESKVLDRLAQRGPSRAAADAQATDPDSWRAARVDFRRYHRRREGDDDSSPSSGSTSSNELQEISLHGLDDFSDDDEDVDVSKIDEMDNLMSESTTEQRRTGTGKLTLQSTVLMCARAAFKRLFRFIVGGSAVCTKKELGRCMKRRRSVIRKSLLAGLVLYVLILLVVLMNGLEPVHEMKVKHPVKEDLHALPKHAWRAAGLGPPPDESSTTSTLKAMKRR